MASEAAPGTALVVGGGIVGPVVALLLQKKGWNPIIVEKVRDVGASGLAIALHPNGLKVLNKTGAAQEILKSTTPWELWDEYSDSNEYLGGPGSKQIGDWEKRYGWPALGVSRTRIQLALKAVAEGRGIRYETGWRLKQIEETQNGIVAYSGDGKTISADFVLGCDGLKSSVREQLLANKGISTKDPDFSGIAVLGGVGPMTDFQKSHPGVNNWYGPTTCVISHPLEDGTSVWGLNYIPSTAVPESWQSISKDEVAEKIEDTKRQFEQWPETLRQCIAASTKLQTIGLYDRPELPADQWYHGRIMLLGDAAHPGTPHIGQGANQGLVDCWTLCEELPDFHGTSLSQPELEAAFKQVADKRQPLTSMLVKMAREAGENRVVRGGESDVEGRQKRDKAIYDGWQSLEKMNQRFDPLYTGPFSDLGGYKAMLQSQ